jgi:hypothetical protein
VLSYSGSGDYFIDISAGTAPPPADTTAPTITSVSPAEGATGIAVTANVSVTFSEPMDKASAEGAFSIAPSVAGAFSWSGNTMTFDPTADLAAGTTYTATVSTAAKDTAGNALAAAKSWSFTTTTLSTFTKVPDSVTIETGTLRKNGVAELGASDNVYYQVNSTTSGTRTTSWYGSFTGVSNNLANLKVTYEGRNSKDATQTIKIWNWKTGAWDQLDSRTVGNSDVLIADLLPAAPLERYVSGAVGTVGEVRIQIRATRERFGFFASGDWMRIVYDAP